MRQPGDVFDYPFKWAVDEDAGLDNAKDRRTTLALIKKTIRAADGVELTHMILLGITDSPRPDQAAVGVPDIERRRAGLVANRAAFVIVSEYDYDIIPGSLDYNPNSKTYGRFSASFHQHIKMQLSTAIRTHVARRIDMLSGPTR